MLQGTVLELLRCMVEEADDLPQAGAWVDRAPWLWLVARPFCRGLLAVRCMLLHILLLTPSNRLISQLQAQLDLLLTRLLPAHRAESPAGHALAAALLQRTETTVRTHAAAAAHMVPPCLAAPVTTAWVIFDLGCRSARRAVLQRPSLPHVPTAGPAIPAEVPDSSADGRPHRQRAQGRLSLAVLCGGCWAGGEARTRRWCCARGDGAVVAVT